jgi:chromosome partitioning protein
MMIPIKTACHISNLTDRTIRDWITDGKIIGGKDDLTGILHVDKESLLKSLPTSICFYNQKGGVGKTTISVMMADYFDKKGVKTLLIDLDQQANLSQSYFDYDDIRGSSTLYNYLEDKTPLAKCIKTYNDNIDVLPADIRLSRKDNYDLDELDSIKADFIPIFRKYQIVIIDCPPSLSAMSKFGLLLSNYVFIPVIPEPYSFDGMFETLNNLKRMTKFCADFIDYRVIITNHEMRKLTLHENYVDMIKNDKKIRSAVQTIPNSVAMKERPLHKSNIFDMYGNDKGVKKLETLLDELYNAIYIERGNK